MPFSYLNIKTDAQVGDSIITIKKLVPQLAKLGHKAAGIANYGNMFDCIAFYKACKKNDIKPILGCELHIKDGEESMGRGTLLYAMNYDGYENLCQLVSIANNPKNRDEHPTHYWISIEDFKSHNNGVVSIGNPTTIIVPECRYLEKQDAYVLEAYMAILSKAKLSDKTVDDGGKRRTFSQDFPAHLMSAKDIKKAGISDDGGTQQIVDMCNLELDLTQIRLPKFDIGKSKSALDYLKDKLRIGWKNKGISSEKKNNPYLDRLNKELGDIENAHIADYFLMVQDVMDWARSQGIKVGYGRGSAAGSLVAWLLDIQFPNPIENDLIWERFYNVGRGMSLPDIDMDFSQLRRGDVIKYLQDKYGDDCVAHTVTFSTFAMRKSLQHALKVFGVPFDTQTRISKLVPFKAKSLAEAIEECEELKKEEQSFKHAFDIARKIEGLKSNAGVHASAIMISNDPLAQQIPMYLHVDKIKKTHMMVTGYDMYTMEDLGYLKLDVLGIRNLDILKYIEDLVNA